MKIIKLYFTIFICIILYLYFSAYLFTNDEKKCSTNLITTCTEYSLRIGSPSDNKDIIKFSHQKHVKELEIKCIGCHTKAPASENSSDGLTPVKSACAACHDVQDNKQCSLCHYDNIFKKLVPTIKGLYFSHKTHIKLGKQCSLCHKNMEKFKYSNENPSKYPVMEVCYTCHNQQSVPDNASGDCEACHTNLTNLKPHNHLYANFLNEHKWIFETSSENNNCMMCHSDNFCQVCHSAGNYTGENKSYNFYAPYYTKNTGTRIDRTSLQKLNSIHQLNYLYTHSIDAKHKSFECKTCHDASSFCASCHLDDGNIVSGIMPKSHLSPNFKTFGVNSGGGLHSEMAKRDIELCQNCHDANGADPVCIRCHFDNDGVKGTNPKTHERGFLKDEKGIWHNTEGAICYLCHNDVNARPNGLKGVRFCGYCHK